MALVRATQPYTLTIEIEAVVAEDEAVADTEAKEDTAEEDIKETKERRIPTTTTTIIIAITTTRTMKRVMASAVTVQNMATL
jgi:hypothetical protein